MAFRVSNCGPTSRDIQAPTPAGNASTHQKTRSGKVANTDCATNMLQQGTGMMMKAELTRSVLSIYRQCQRSMICKQESFRDDDIILVLRGSQVVGVYKSILTATINTHYHQNKAQPSNQVTSQSTPPTIQSLTPHTTNHPHTNDQPSHTTHHNVINLLSQINHHHHLDHKKAPLTALHPQTQVFPLFIIATT